MEKKGLESVSVSMTIRPSKAIRNLAADKSAICWQMFPNASNLQGPVDCHFCQSATWERWPMNKTATYSSLQCICQSLRSSNLCIFFSVIFHIQNASHLLGVPKSTTIRAAPGTSGFLAFDLTGIKGANGVPLQFGAFQTPSKDIPNINDLNVCAIFGELWKCRTSCNTTGMLWCLCCNTPSTLDGTCRLQSCWISSLQFRFLAPLWSCHCEEATLRGR